MFFWSSHDADASCQTSKNERLLKMLEVSGTCLGPGDRCALVSIKGKFQKKNIPTTCYHDVGNIINSHINYLLSMPYPNNHDLHIVEGYC